MKRFGLIGYPLGHSFSAQYFTDKFKREAISDAIYENYPIENISLLDSILSRDLLGFNVTIPYKEQVMAYLDNIDDQAKSIGAVNCVKVRYQKGFEGKLKEGYHLTGYNSDVYGLELSLKEMLPKERITALILGTGGAAKAAIFVLKKLAIPFVVVSRRDGDNTISYDKLKKEDIANNHLIINTTPLGMYPHVDQAVEIPYDSITDKHILFDLIYNPGETLFLHHGRMKGATVRSGYYMLKMQAERGFQIFTEGVDIMR